MQVELGNGGWIGLEITYAAGWWFVKQTTWNGGNVIFDHAPSADELREIALS